MSFINIQNNLLRNIIQENSTKKNVLLLIKHDNF